MKYKIWNKTDNLITPVGEVLTPPQVIERYPAAGIEGIKFIIADQPINMAVFMEFEATKNIYKQQGVQITDDMTDEEVLQAIQEFEETPPVQMPTAEERIASALEFQNLLVMPDMEVDI
jgi:hypothetical protein